MTDISDVTSSIQQCILFNNIEHDKAAAIIENSLTNIKEYSSKQVILSSGSTLNEFGVVLSGSVVVEYNDKLGNRTIITELFPGQLLWDTYMSENRCGIIFDIAAHKECSIAFLDKTKLIEYCTDTDVLLKLTQNMLSVAVNTACSAELRLRNICQRSTRSKLLVYLREQSQLQQSNKITIPFNRQELADYLCVDRSAMSKELRRMKKDNLIDFNGNIFEVR